MTAARGDPVLEHSKGEDKGAAQTNRFVPTLTLSPAPSAPLFERRLGRGVWSEGVKLSLGQEGRKGVGLMLIFLFPATQICNYIVFSWALNKDILFFPKLSMFCLQQ